jgi:aspartyl-tRNA(Asn)/glutamyl-tRNA(Gln) amidotransferase subunit A
MCLLSDPLTNLTLTEFGSLYRRGLTSSAAITDAYLVRIAALDPQLRAFEYVALEPARATAHALDTMLAAGTDLGPLMGVPVAIKDLFAVDGMPTTAGSNIDVTDLIGPEGSFVKRLRRAGCVILGKTKTVEFAFGAVGANAVRGTPRNPWDADIERIPGGSSSGSAVAVAAGLCAFAVGSDTGGSVRLPAALRGVFGLKTTVGLWATDGVFPLSPTFDSIGLLTRSATDAALAFSAVEEAAVPTPAAINRLRFGIPRSYLHDGLDLEVRECLKKACAILVAKGSTLVSKDMSYASEREGFFGPVLATEMLASLGRDIFLQSRGVMDPVIAARADQGLRLSAVDYVRMIRRHQALKVLAAEDMTDIDAWLTPTAAILPVDIGQLADREKELALVSSITRNTQPMNLFGQCGSTTPVNGLGSTLPVGLQITCCPFEERRVLSIALAIEQLVGAPPRPDVAQFVRQAPEQR